MFNISLEGGCLKCGSPCLSAVAAALPACVDPGVAVGGTIGGGVFDLSITAGRGTKSLYQKFPDCPYQMCFVV